MSEMDKEEILNELEAGQLEEAIESVQAQRWLRTGSIPQVSASQLKAAIADLYPLVDGKLEVRSIPASELPTFSGSPVSNSVPSDFSTSDPASESELNDIFNSIDNSQIRIEKDFAEIDRLQEETKSLLELLRK